jgi:hypothetical protein
MTKETKIVPVQKRKMLDLREYMRTAKHSVLCSGPMSKNCVDAVIGLANEQKRPMPLIASRRQVECAEYGGGYVENWDTRTFAEYVQSKDKGYVHICRDHGGPWQGATEAGLPQREAMERAKIALLEDLSSGFDLVHLDPSIEGVPLTDATVMEMLFELYAFVIESSKTLGVNVEIEVGAEQQNGFFSDPRELVTLLKEISDFCDTRRYKKPLFCVVQTGTLVKEMRNVGMTEGRKNEAYDQKYAVDSMEKSVQFLVDISRINGVFVKEHNADYLSDGSTALRRRLGVGAVNIAPQYGVCETKSLISLCTQLGLKRQLDRMLDIFYTSKKWSKWLSADGKATDLEKAIIAGHYSFSNPEFLKIKEEIAFAAVKKGINVDQYLVSNLRALLQQLTWNLGYFHNIYSGSHDSAVTTPSVSSAQDKVATVTTV